MTDVPHFAGPEAMMARAIRVYIGTMVGYPIQAHALVGWLVNSWYGRSMPRDQRVAAHLQANVVNRVLRNCRIGRVQMKAGWRTRWTENTRGRRVGWLSE